MKNNISDIRREYIGKPLSKKDVDANPLVQFEKWFDEALKADSEDPTALTLATSSATGRVTSRIVLLKGIEKSGFVFYTNFNSKKAFQIAENPYGSMTFYWPELIRQVRVEGKITKVPDAMADKYFDSRPEESKISAWASDQSNEVPNRKHLEEKSEQIRSQFKDQKIPRPEFWGGYVLKPERVEFWQGRESRLHDRVEYQIEKEQWNIRRLAP